MIRTRDFLVFLSLAGFLFVAIVLTLAWSHRTHAPVAAHEVQFSDTTATYTAEAVMPVDTKSDRLAALRKKLAADTSVIAADTPIEPDVATSSDTETVSAPAGASVQLCGKSYVPKTIAGLTGMQHYAERAGQRVFYNLDAPVTLGTSTPATPVETVLFTLPLRTEPLAVTSCIKDDVVAVSPAGLTIRNTDFAKYQSSGEATLLGYTLDGFPLYGRTNSVTTDACGGAVVGGAYRYYISAERKGVIGCFAGIPVAL